jgi:phosphate transport system protein
LLTPEGQLDRLEAALQDEGRLALRSLRLALDAVRQDDVEVADRVIGLDDEVDEVYREIDAGVQAALAHHPTTVPRVRLALCILRASVHLERIADYAVTIAKLAKLASGLARDEEVFSSLDEMGARAQEMIRAALDSFARRDVVGAESLVHLDEVIDRANIRLVQQLLDVGDEPALRAWGLWMVLASRCLERIGDHAVDIGEQTAFLVTGQFREFTDASRPVEAIGGGFWGRPAA